MNLLIYDLSEWCKEMTVKNFIEYAWIPKHLLYYKKWQRCGLDKDEEILLNEWLESKIKELIRYKKRAEKLLDSNS